jgi:dGTPase
VTVREIFEEREAQTLSKFATLSSKSVGRVYPERPCDYRTEFQRDRDRIIHSKAFRRLKHKTQVFIAPEGDHYRTRLTHTLEVTQIARTIARGLFLNEDLTEAIALGHDLGHTPFGHAGEDALNKIYPGGFQHNQQSLRVVEKLERGMLPIPGLNLTFEVRDGIVNHTGDGVPCTLEGKVVKFADRIAYINHDIDDAIRAGLLRQEDLPKGPLELLGATGSQRIDTLVRDLINSSAAAAVRHNSSSIEAGAQVGVQAGASGSGHAGASGSGQAGALGSSQIVQSPEIGAAMNELRCFLFQQVYIGSRAKVEETKVSQMLQMLYKYYLAHLEELPPDDRQDESPDREVCDYIAGMTDRFAMADFARRFLPAAWQL